MKLKTFYTIWCIIFLLAAIWNVLCLTALLPLKLYNLSFAVVMLVNVISIVMTYRMNDPGQRKDKIKNPTFGIFLCLAIAWLVTHVACGVYPL